jgi:succinate dehydrogenase/fumarate reductase flavoprotein subunit
VSPPGPAERLTFDLVVIGGGMAGLTAGAAAARGGAKVAVLERSLTLGGSAALSVGVVWMASTVDTFRLENPLGDPGVAEAVVEGFPDALAWIQSLDVKTSPSITLYEFGRGAEIDILTYHRRCAAIITSAGGSITLGADTRALILNGERRVVGAKVRQDGDLATVHGDHVLLATGGFQANDRLRARYIHRNARRMLVRSNQYSRGDGLRLGLSVGATTSSWMEGFYGHLISSPTTRFEAPEYRRLTQAQSGYSILVNRAGDRFTDESAGDVFNTQAVLRQPGARALLIVDEYIRREFLVKPHRGGNPGLVGQFEDAVQMGARYTKASSPAELGDHVRAWGYDGASLVRTIRRYDATTLLPDDPPRRRHHRPLKELPLHALEVQPAITYTHGGLRTNRHAQVLRIDGSPVPGLLAAGVDAGGTYQKGHAGGLSVATVQGLAAARTAGFVRET